MTRSTLLALVLTCGGSIGCGQRIDEPTSSTVSLPQNPDPDLVIEKLSVVRANRTPDEVAAIVHKVAQVMLASELPLNAFVESMIAARATRTDADGPEFATPIEDVGVTYYAEADDLRMEVKSLLDERNLNREYDVGAEVAELTAQRTLDELLATNIGEGSYDFAKAREGTRTYGSGRGNEAPTEWIVDRTWTVPRVHNGTTFENDLISISVHRSGSISRIRRCSLQIISNAGASRVPASTVDDARGKFTRDYPRARVDRLSVSYALPYGARTADLEPRLVASFAQVFGASEEAINRRQIVAYSLTDPGSPPSLLTPPSEPEASSDRPRPSQQ